MRRKPFDEQRVGGMIACEGAMRDLKFRYSIARKLMRRFAKGERLGLREEEVRHQQVVMRRQLIERLRKANKIAWDQLVP